MRVALDVNRYKDAAEGEPAAVDVVTRAERIYMPFVVLGELRAGFRTGSKGRENERALVRFLKTPHVRVLLADEETTVHYASLYQYLKSQGTPIPVNDLWIAAMCVQHGLLLHTRDAHFDQLPQVQRV